jgi:hypothetical protein
MTSILNRTATISTRSVAHLVMASIEAANRIGTIFQVEYLVLTRVSGNYRKRYPDLSSQR